MNGFIPVPVVPNSCILCDFCENYRCHAVGEYYPKYTAGKYKRPEWCPIKVCDDIRIDDKASWCPIKVSDDIRIDDKASQRRSEKL